MKSFKILCLPLSSLLPAFTSWLSGQPEPHHASRLGKAAVSLAVVIVVQGLVVSGRCQQTQVRVRGMVRLLLGTAVPFSCHLWAREGKEDISDEGMMNRIRT